LWAIIYIFISPTGSTRKQSVIKSTQRGPSVCLSVSLAVTLMHPDKAIRWNEMPFGRDTRVVPSNTVLDRGLRPLWEGEIGSGNLRSKFALQIETKLSQIAESEWLL